MKASIDIGTNTVLLLIAEINGGKLNVIHEEQRMPRLGKGVDENKKLSEAGMDRVIDALHEYKNIIERDFKEVDSVIVTATSATRDAQNRTEFLQKIESATGWVPRVLSGEEEAEYTYKGALSVMPETSQHEILVLDIGGGSTEIILGNQEKIKQAVSFDMGCVRFTERYLLHDPPFQEELSQCRHAIEYMFESKKIRHGKNVQAFGVAGTLTSLAVINLQIENYRQDLINGHRIQKDKLSKGIDSCSLHTHEELLELSPTIMKGREDVFLAGLLILEGFLKYFKLPDIRVSTGGVRHGALIS